MLKRLRIKFVCINMAIVTIMLCLALGLVLHFTQENLERQSIQMMQAIASDPFQPGRPNDRPDDVLLPYFSVHLDHHEELWPGPVHCPIHRPGPQGKDLGGEPGGDQHLFCSTAL